jgi:hypothetical protein
MKSKPLILLICALLFVAAVDTIPDPPAINPPSGHNSRLSSFHPCRSFTLLEKEWSLASGSPGHFQLYWFSFRLVFEKKTAIVFPLPLVRHAADSSPPLFS